MNEKKRSPLLWIGGIICLAALVFLGLMIERTQTPAKETDAPAVPLEEEAEYPQFQLPVPETSKSHSLSLDDLNIGSTEAENLTFGAIDEKLFRVLDDLGYDENRYFGVLNNTGFVLMTQLEKINEDGKSKTMEGGRFKIETAKSSIQDIGDSIFKAPEIGLFRVFIFLIAPAEGTSSDGNPLTFEATLELSTEGAPYLHPDIAEITFIAEYHAINVYVYEFEKLAEGKQPRQRDEGLSGKEHLETSCILFLLREQSCPYLP